MKNLLENVLVSYYRTRPTVATTPSHPSVSRRWAAVPSTAATLKDPKSRPTAAVWLVRNDPVWSASSPRPPQRRILPRPPATTILPRPPATTPPRQPTPPPWTLAPRISHQSLVSTTLFFFFFKTLFASVSTHQYLSVQCTSRSTD